MLYDIDDNVSVLEVFEGCVQCLMICNMTGNNWHKTTIVLQRYSVFVDSLYYCKYLPITKIFLENYL